MANELLTQNNETQDGEMTLGDALALPKSTASQSYDFNASVEGYIGNIDLKNRSVINNPDGTFSSEISFSNIDENPKSKNYGKEVLVPQIVNGKKLSRDEAWQHYEKTNENLGVFNSANEADVMAKKIHERGYNSQPILDTGEMTLEQAMGQPAITESFVNPIPKEYKSSFIKSMVMNLYAGMINGATSFNELIGLGLTPFKDVIASGKQEVQKIREETYSQNKGIQFANDLVQSFGNMGVTLPIDIMTGYATKTALVGKILPEMEVILSKIPDFALGSGWRGIFGGIEAPGNVAQKTIQGVVGAGENIAINSLYASAGVGLKGIGTMAALGAADATYNAAKEGRPPSKDELLNGSAQGAAYGIVFSILPHLKQATKIGVEKLALRKYETELNTHINNGDLAKVQATVDKMMVDKRIRPGIKEAINKVLLTPTPTGEGKVGGIKIEPIVQEAITNTQGAKITPWGIELDISRYQKQEQFGSQAIRTGVFYLPEAKSPYGKYYSTGKEGYGGGEKITGRTTYRNPIIVKAGTGGKGVEKAYDQVKGKGAYQKMRSDVLDNAWTKDFANRKPDENAISGLLEKYGGNPDLAYEIIRTSKKGNLLPYAIQEHIAAHALREAGYDAVISHSISGGKPRLAEVFDLRAEEYPSELSDYKYEDFYPKLSTPTGQKPPVEPPITIKSGQVNVGKIAESIKGTLKKVKQAVSNLNSVFNPASKVISKLGGEPYAQVIKAIHTPEAEVLGFDNAKSNTLDKSFMELEQDFAKLSPQVINDFNLVRGKAQSPIAQALQAEARGRLNLKDKSLINAIKETSDYVYQYAKDNGINLNYFEDYFYGSYKNPNQVAKFLDYWRSTEKYTKEKTLPTIADAQVFGLELKDPNPITNIRKEMLAVAQRVGLKNLREQQLLEGHNYAVETEKATSEQLKQWDKINDPVFNKMLFDPEYSKFVNSLLSTNKITGNKITGALRQAAFFGQQIKFFGSLFHLRNEAKAIISDESCGLFNKEGYKNLVKSFKPIDQTSPEYKEYTKLGGGHKYSLESQAQTQLSIIEKYLDTLGKGTYIEPVTNVLKGLVKSKWVPASPAQIKWMFDEFIPAVKFIKFQEECANKAKELGRLLTDAEKIDIIKTGQNFYGEMNERLFGRSGTVTSALRLVFQAPGYGEGNFRALFTSVKELEKGTINFAKGKGFTKEGQRNMRFVISSLFSTLTLGVLGTWIMTGKPPEKPKTSRDIRDLFKIKTNILDGNGDSVYFDMMGYDNDFWALYGNLATGQPEKILPTLGKRVSGATSTVIKTLNDMTTIFNGGAVYNFMGKPIYYKTDSTFVKLGKFLAYEGTQAQPISLGSFGQATQKGTNPLISGATSIVGLRSTTSEQVKDTKAARSDLFSMRDSKDGQQLEIDKLYNENPDEAIKQAYKFNIDQITKIIQIAKKEGIEGISESDVKGYLIYGAKNTQDQEKAGTSVEGMLLKSERQKSEKRENLEFTSEQEDKMQALLDKLP